MLDCLKNLSSLSFYIYNENNGSCVASESASHSFQLACSNTNQPTVNGCYYLPSQLHFSFPSKIISSAKSKEQLPPFTFQLIRLIVRRNREILLLQCGQLAISTQRCQLAVPSSSCNERKILTFKVSSSMSHLFIPYQYFQKLIKTQSLH